MPWPAAADPIRPVPPNLPLSQMRSVPRTIAGVFFAFVLLPLILHARPPEWLAEVAGRAGTMEYEDASHVVLLDDCHLTLDKNGVVTRRIRYAIRVLTRDGREAAIAVVPYQTSSDKVKSFQAWTLPKAGKPIEYSRKRVLDMAYYSNSRELYHESRKQVISGYDDATPGAVFGYESIVIEKSIYTQMRWHFQQKVPVEYSGITITLPPGWTSTAHTFNRDPIAPKIAGASQTWALHSLPGTSTEPLGPPDHFHLPWLAIDYHPPAGAGPSDRIPSDSWASLSAYFSHHYETASTVTPAIREKAAAIVSDASSTWERIARLCRFAQAVNYISISINAAQAGGMIPRPASRVLECNYGDCKDKTALLRALLRAQDIDSYPVVVYSGDASRVRPGWVSPSQFNHCILAIAVDDSISAPGVVTHPRLGRLLVFDPTNENTPPGWLAKEDLGGHALVLAGDRGELILLPTLAPEQNRYERIIKARLSPGGSIVGTLTENFHGHSASAVREERREASETDYRTKIIEPWLGRTLPSPITGKLETKDDFNDARFSIDLEFRAAAYGKTMRDTLLVFKPVIVARRENLVLKRGKRSQPVVIHSSSFVEHAEIELPPGFALDETFPSAELTSPFGRYHARAAVRDGHLLFERALELRATTLPASEYETARVFFEKILQAEQSPVVLRRL